MAEMTPLQQQLMKSREYMYGLLKYMLQHNAADMFITVGFPPAMKIDGKMTPIGKQNLTTEQTMSFARSIMNDKQFREFETTKECNFAINPEGIGRFRVNAFVQQGKAGLVIRVITATIPDFEKLDLPPVLKEVIMAKRGLVLMVGGTGSGKSTTLAAMIGYRNQNSHGHIITIEDPIEYVHPHLNCLITQREVGVDTDTWFAALKNTLRQAPDVILIGEIRDRDTMEYALNFAETGHLCISTLHANSANQAIERIINFFPQERHHQLYMDIAGNLKALVSQRLIPKKDGKGRRAAIEILLNSPLVQDMIFKGDIHGIKEVMGKSREQGMQTFDQALFELYKKGEISYEEALRNADSSNEVRLKIKMDGGDTEKGGSPMAGLEHLSLTDDPKIKH